MQPVIIFHMNLCFSVGSEANKFKLTPLFLIVTPIAYLASEISCFLPTPTANILIPSFFILAGVSSTLSCPSVSNNKNFPGVDPVSLA